MLLCVVVVFLLCNVWALIANMVEAMSNGKTIDWLVQFSNMLVTINSSVNFVIYVIFGEKFKRLFFKLFFPQGVCGWNPVAGGRNGGAGGHGGIVDESEATGNGAAVVECQFPGGRANRASRRAHHQHHHQHHQHHQHHHDSHQYNVNERRGTGNTASSALSLYGNDSAAGSGGNGDAGPAKIKREHSTGTAVEESQI